MSRFLTRRRVLWGAAGAVVITGAGALASIPICNARRADLGQAAERFAVALPDIHAPERLAAWIRREADETALHRALVLDAALGEARELSCPAARRARIAAAVRDDFRAGDIVLADRIVAARTECLVAAICLGPERSMSAVS